MIRNADRIRIFQDRRDAGRRLAKELEKHIVVNAESIVLALPRGGVPVGFEVAAALGAPLDVMLVRKLGAPFNAELALGAIAEGGEAAYNEGLLAQLGLDEADLEPIRQRESVELERRNRRYRGGRSAPALKDRIVILVDDGIATGATMCAAVHAVRKQAPRRVIVAAPTCSVQAAAELQRIADRVVALALPEPYIAVGAWYESFGQLSDEEVTDLLARSSAASA